MKIETVYLASQYVAKIVKFAASKGMLLRVGSDFRSFHREIRRFRPEQELSDPFNPELHYLRDGNGFWVVGHDESGKLVHTQALRSLDLADQTLSSYLTERFRDFPPTNAPVDLDASSYGGGPAARAMSGKVMYHGEFWIAGNGAGMRGNGLTGLLPRLSVALAMLRHDPDYIFGFVRETEAVRGMTERVGFMHVEPGALNWVRTDGVNPIHGFMIWMGRNDMEHLLRIPIATQAKAKSEPLRATGTQGG